MRPDEVRALADLGGGAAAGLATQVRDVHRGIAARLFAALGPPAAPVRVLHDRIAEGAYGAARVLAGSVVSGGALAVGLARGDGVGSITDSARGRAVVGALNGAWGDRLAQRASLLATPMALRIRGVDVALDAASLAAAYPDATGRLAVFVHGLGETDGAWRRRADRHVPYGDRLRSELGYTPLLVNYNSGLHISSNGRALARLIEQLTAAWPVPVAEIAIIGHSMGGLVARSACHYADPGSWRERVRHVFLLGTPHRGAPLELAANAACHTLSMLPETRPFAAPIKLRSAGVKDLGYGYVVDEDWQGHDPDAFCSDTGTVVPFLQSANHYFVAATLTRDAEHPVGRLVGDLLVLRSSAWSRGGRGERLQFGIDRYRHLGGASHLDLLNHPAVYAQLRRWLTVGRELPAAV
ncbi:MAG: esterase/lipase family protein [Solirubrobacteraceae bacterium]